VASVTKRDVKAGEVLDGEGGYTVFGRLTASEESIRGKYLPLGLSRGAKMVRAVPKDSFVTYDDVKLDETPMAFKLRRALEGEF